MLLCAGRIPEELGALAKLTVLRLEYNKLKGEGQQMKVLISISRTFVLR